MKWRTKIFVRPVRASREAGNRVVRNLPGRGARRSASALRSSSPRTLAGDALRLPGAGYTIGRDKTGGETDRARGRCGRPRLRPRRTTEREGPTRDMVRGKLARMKHPLVIGLPDQVRTAGVRHAVGGVPAHSVACCSGPDTVAGSPVAARAA